MKDKKRKLRFTTIRVDEEVKRLIDNAKIVGIRDSANNALRRLLGLDKLETQNPDAQIYECESCGYSQVGPFKCCPKCGETKYISTVTYAQSEGG